MDIATLLGIFSGIALLLASIMQNSGLELFYSPPSAMIVLGGTIAATLVAYPINELFGVLGLFVKVFMTKKRDLYDLIDTMVMTCSVARKGGVLAIESRLDDIDNGISSRQFHFGNFKKSGAVQRYLVRRKRGFVSFRLCVVRKPER